MITVTANRKKLELTVKGHSPVDDRTGRSLVCCAASTLFYALAYNVGKRNEEKENLIDFQFRDESGDACMKICPEGYAYIGYSSIFDHFLNGFRMLEENYPEQVKVIEE